MGMAYPQYELDNAIINSVLDTIEETKAEFWDAEKRKKITERPLRANEVNTTFTIDNRTYVTTFAGKTWQRICGATASIKVKTGSVYIFLGWIFIDDPTATVGVDALARIKIEGTVQQEVSLYLTGLQENSALLTLDQIVVAAEDTDVEIEVISPTVGAGTVLAFPLAYRIGPISQLNKG